MRGKVKVTSGIFLILSLFFLVPVKTAFGYVPYTVTPTNPDGNTTRFDENTASITVQFSGVTLNTQYQICLLGGNYCQNVTSTSAANSTATLNNICGDSTFLKYVSGGCAPTDFFWGDTTYPSVKLLDQSNNMLGIAPIPKVERYYPSFDIQSDNGFKPGSGIQATVKGSRRPTFDACRNSYKVEVDGNPNPPNNTSQTFSVTDSNGNVGSTWLGGGNLNLVIGTYSAKLVGKCQDSINGVVFATIGFTIDPNGGAIIQGPSAAKGPLVPGHNPCSAASCQTAIGDIPTNLGDFATVLLRIALGISGGIVLILMVFGSIRVMTSAGDPQRVAGGRDMIVAALAGALFIAFSVMIMQFLGTTIVPIPGLTFNP